MFADSQLGFFSLFESRSCGIFAGACSVRGSPTFKWGAKRGHIEPIRPEAHSHLRFHGVSRQYSVESRS